MVSSALRGSASSTSRWDPNARSCPRSSVRSLRRRRPVAPSIVHSKPPTVIRELQPACRVRPRPRPHSHRSLAAEMTSPSSARNRDSVVPRATRATPVAAALQIIPLPVVDTAARREVSAVRGTAPVRVPTTRPSPVVIHSSVAPPAASVVATATYTPRARRYPEAGTATATVRMAAIVPVARAVESMRMASPTRVGAQ
jgi:hypothetical protein